LKLLRPSDDALANGKMSSLPNILGIIKHAHRNKSVALSNSSFDLALMEKDLKVVIGRSIRVAREARGMTQEQFAEAIGRHIDSVSLIERGRTLPALDTLIGISNVVGVGLDALVRPFDQVDDDETKVVLTELQFRLESLPQEKAKLALEIVKLIADKP